MADNEAELETSFTSQTPLYNEPLETSFISFSNVKEKGWL